MVTRVQDPAGLLDAARRSEPGAAMAFVDAWLPVVLAWCTRLGGGTVDAEDAAHDVWIIVLARLDTVRQPDRFAGWLFQVTRSVLRKHRRRAWLRERLPGGSVDRPDSGPDPVEQYEQSETARRVRLALESLRPRHREVLVLCDLEERPATEVAQMLRVPVGTVKSRVRLAREQFRRAALQAGLAPVLLDAHERGEL